MPTAGKRLLLALLALLLLAGASSCSYLDRKEGEWIFRPASGDYFGNRAVNANFQEHWIPVGKEGEKLHAWWSPVADANAPVLLYLHGARWSLSGSASRIPRWNQMGFSVLAIDYRGFGKSSPRSPSEQSANEDSEAAWDYLGHLAPGARRYLFGHSLGGAMATHLALLHPEAAGLILEATFTNIPELVRYYPWGVLPVGPLITQRFDNLDRIAQVKVPILFAHGTSDTTVPFAMSEQLFRAAQASKRLFKAEGASHHNVAASQYDGYRQAVNEFFGLPAHSIAAQSNATSTGTR